MTESTILSKLRPGSTLIVGPGYDHIVELFTELNGHKFCGQCRLCKRAMSNVHPDLIISREDTVEEARRIASSMSHKSSELKYRVIGILGYRPKQVQNILLKSLEEPGKDTHVIWTLPSLEGLLPTVISRCRIIRLEAPIKTVSKEAKAHAKALDDAVSAKQLIKLLMLPVDWEDAVAVAMEYYKLRLDAHKQGAPIDRLEGAASLVKIIRRGRPPQNYTVRLVK